MCKIQQKIELNIQSMNWFILGPSNQTSLNFDQSQIPTIHKLKKNILS